MTALETVQSVQFVTVNEKRFAVIDAEEWEALVEWLETLEDTKVVQESYDELAQAEGNRQKAGWLRWEDIREEVE